MVTGMLAATWGAALFDLDGTLVDSEPANRAAYLAYFAARGWDVEPEFYQHFRGRRGRDVFSQLSGPWSGEDPATLMAGVNSYLDHTSNPPLPVPGAVELIHSLHTRDIPIALVTSTTRRWAEFALTEVLDVRPYFTALITREDTESGKPDPAPFSAAAAAVNVAPIRAVAFEDAIAGIRSALAAGIGHVVGVAAGIEAEGLRSVGAHRVVAALAELM